VDIGLRVIVAILGYVACNYLFIAPRHAIGPIDAPTLVGIAVYAVTCALIIAIGEAMRSAQRVERSRPSCCG
jgi:K+-sensing histidine kinase KdpD